MSGIRSGEPNPAKGSSSGASSGSSAGGRSLRRTLTRPATLAAIVLLLSYLTVLYRVTVVVGGSDTLVLGAAAALVAATVLGRFLRLRTAVVLSLVIIAGGLAMYFFSVPASNRALFTTDRVLSDVLALLTGLSVLRLTKAGTWALAIAPAPTFLAWYLAIRNRYGLSVLVGGGTLCFFVLTGDANAATTLVGVVAAAAAVGFDTLDVRGGLSAQGDALVMVLASMVVLAAVLSVVPGGAAQPLLSGGGTSTVETSLISSSDEVNVLGSIRLSPKVRFEVTSGSANGDEYWQTAAYDRYTGRGWIRSGEDTSLDQLQRPPGASRRVVQNVQAKTSMSAIPAAWRPVGFDGEFESSVEATQQGSLKMREGTAIKTNESYRVRSEVPQYTTEQLRRSGDDYPEYVTGSYLQLPETTTDRVRQKAADVAGNQSNSYDKAVAIREYLKQNKEYSLTVEQPDGDIADAFLFEMDAGYCTYYATTMVVMLRSQGIPARFVTGYTTGEKVQGDKYVVRGLDAHAWVQVYFPDVGWVTFDPTPGEARERAENARLEEARQSGESGVDTEETKQNRKQKQNGNQNQNQNQQSSGNPTPTSSPTPESPAGSNGGPSNVEQTPPEFGDTGNGTSAAAAPGFGETTTPSTGGGFEDELPSRETLAVLLALLVGLVAGARRVGFVERAYRFLWMRYQGSRSGPEPDTERAFRRLEYLLSREYRPRRTGETPRSYLTALAKVGVDDRALEVGRLYERAHYGSGISREEADYAIGLVDRLVRERTPLVGTLRGRSRRT